MNVSMYEERLKIFFYNVFIKKNLKEKKSAQNSKYNWDLDLYKACLGENLLVFNLIMTKKRKEYLNWGLKGACQGGNLNLTKILIDKGADDYNLGLSWVCRQGCRDYGKSDWDWLFCYEFSKDDERKDIVNLLVEKGGTQCNHCGMMYKKKNVN